MDDTEKNKLEAIRLLTTIAQNEYDNEHKRTDTIDSKAGIALPIISAYFLKLTEMCDFKPYLSSEIHKLSDFIYPGLSLASYFSAIVFTILSVIWMARVVWAHKYARIEPKDFCTDKYLKGDTTNLSSEIMGCYISSYEFNSESNSARVKLYKRSWKFAFISLFFFVIFIVLKNNAF